MSIYNFAGNTDVVVDLDGYYSPWHSGSKYYPLVTPARIVDTRPGSGSPLLRPDAGYRDDPDHQRACGHLCPVPAGTGFIGPGGIFTGVDINTTITDTTGDGGYLTQYPSNAGSTPPLASDLNWDAGDIVSNANQISSGGVPSIAIDNFNFTGDADLVIDLYGYFGHTVNDGDNG